MKLATFILTLIGITIVISQSVEVVNTNEQTNAESKQSDLDIQIDTGSSREIGSASNHIISSTNINDDAEDNTSNISSSSSSSTSKLNDVQPVQQSRYRKEVIIQRMDNLQEDECHKHSEPNKSKQEKNFFSRVDELKAYKDEHGHLNVRQKENQSLYGFCFNVRQSRIGKGKRTLDDNRIAALDAIGFKWEMVDTRAVFFARVDELRAYKEERGHLKVNQKGDKSLYMFCNHVRQARRVPKCTRTKLTEDRIAALDAIGFDWKLEAGASSSVASKDDKFFAQVDKLRAYKEKHGHLNVSHKKEDRSLYNFCSTLRKARKGKCSHTLDEGRIAALDAIGFNWDHLELKMSSTSPCAMTSKSTQQATNPKIKIGDVGYQFLKEFDSGWYNGTVVEILPDAIGGWARRCIYEDGDCEDLTLNELIKLPHYIHKNIRVQSKWWGT